MAKAKKSTKDVTAIPPTETATVATPAAAPAPAQSPAAAPVEATTKLPKAAKGAAGKKKATPAAAKPSTPTTNIPQIDTSLAAATAARMIGAKMPATTSTGEGRPQSSTFKQLKESMNKPASTGINSILNNTAGPSSKQSGLPFSGGPTKQAGRNQVFGADVNRFNLPRRSGG